MRRLRFISLAILWAAMPVTGADAPARRAGQWQVTMTSDGKNSLIVQQCVDQATDQMLPQSAGPISVAACHRDVQQSGGTLVIDSTCKVDGKSATSHAVVTGNF